MSKEETAKKCRMTKLSKKTNDELISIIIRKDDIERRNSKVIDCLKQNVIGLQKKVDTIMSDKQLVEDECAIKINEISNLQTQSKEYASEMERYKDMYDKELLNNTNIKKSFNYVIYLVIVLIMVIVVLIVL